jgi:asparagine synthase (glutamine-hydrolysing)
MCGIAGILTARTDLDLPSISADMLAAMRHRGPDDEGLVAIELPGGYRLGLAHARLSIMDLSPTGHQPMCDPASGSWIVYNGEIYNHTQVRARLNGHPFRSSGDTETILAGWTAQGSNILAQLRGMFAMGIWDGARKEFWLVRDRLGIKPLYVCALGTDTWIFASEVRTILASRLVAARLDSAAVESYLAFGAVTAPWTLVHGIQSIMPGEAWRFDLSRENPSPTRVRYWQPRFKSTSTQITYREALERLRPVLLEALSIHMLSDVPVGVFLSGGIDSSSIVAALSRQGYPLHTFSVLFGERDYDESVYSRRISQEFGTQHVELEMPPTEVLADLDNAVSAYDQPSIDGLNTFFISQAVCRSGIKVALSGLGGDELFAGYAGFRNAAYLDRPGYRLLARVFQPLLTHLAPGSMRADKLQAILTLRGSRLQTYGILRQLMMGPRRRELLPDTWHDSALVLPPEVIRELTEAVSGLDVLNAYSLLELSLYMANMLLRDTDQMSMSHPVEVRVPLLDHVLVESIAELPGPLKLAGLSRQVQKRLLVDALPTRLPAGVLRRPKMGFVFPWELWLRNQLRDVVSCVFDDRESLAACGISPEGTERLWQRFCASHPGIRYTDILSLVHLLAWVRRNKLSV